MTQATPKAQSSAEQAEPGLRLRNVRKSFGSVVALQPTSFDVPAGTLCALLGPSGCGKTTTLRIVAGFELPDAGQVLTRRARRSRAMSSAAQPMSSSCSARGSIGL